MINLLKIVFVVVAIAMTVVVLMQEGKNAGLSGAITGSSDTYWGKNKGRSVEGLLKKITTILAVAFFVIALVLNIFAS